MPTLLHLSVCHSFPPPLFHYLFWLAVCCGSLISLPLPSQSRLASTVLHLLKPLPLQHTSSHGFLSLQSHWHMCVDRSTHTHTHTYTPLDYLPSPFILPRQDIKLAFPLQKLPITGQHHPGPETSGCSHTPYSVWSIEKDGWSDYKRTHDLTFISCFFSSDIFSFPCSIWLRPLFYNWNWLPWDSASLFYLHNPPLSLTHFLLLSQANWRE